MISISIDVTKLDKSRFKPKIKKDGSKAVYAELVLFEHQSEYGDYLVKQSVTKEESKARIEMPILGNGKNFGYPQDSARRASPAPAPRARPAASGPPVAGDEPPERDDLPF